MYTPRSGAFRKVKYTLPIYEIDEISAESKDEVIKIAKQLTEEEDTAQRANVMVHQDESGGSRRETRRKSTPTSKSIESLKLVDTNEQEGEVSVKPPQFSPSVIDEDVYDKLYPQNVTPSSFPVKSCSDPMYGETEEPDSEYDMDSEDEEWIKSNPQLKITPSRLEYLFCHLNKRNTDIKSRAIWALRPPYHEDFHKIFPYWKVKRLQRNNVSTWRLQNKAKKEPKFKGYISNDPYLVFQSKDWKTKQLSNSTKKRYSKEEVETLFDRVLEIQKKLMQIRSWAHFKVIGGEQNRDHLVNTHASMYESFQESSSRKSQDTDTDADRESNPETRRRKLSERRRSLRTRYGGSQPHLTLPHKNLQRCDQKPQDLTFDDVLKGSWRTFYKKAEKK